jgi:WD40 repeat protein
VNPNKHSIFERKMTPSTLRPINFVWHGKLDDFNTNLAWSPDGKSLAAGSVSGQVAIYDAAEGKALHLFGQAHADGCDAVAWRPDGKALATAGRDGTWKLWDAADGKIIAEHEAGALWAEHLAWSAKPIGKQGHLLALGAGNKVTLWNETGSPAGEPAGEAIKFPKIVTEVAWIMGGTTLAVATSTGISLRKEDGSEGRAFPSRDPILNMAFSPSGKWLMTGNQDCSVHVWNTDSGDEKHMRGFAAKVRQLAWHRASRWLATGGGLTISVWDCSPPGPEGRQPLLLEWHPDQITALHYQPEGDWLASGARDGSIAVWSPTQRQNQISRAKIMSGVTRVAWSPDGKLLAATGESGEVQVLAVD